MLVGENPRSVQFLGSHFFSQVPWRIFAQMSALGLLLAAMMRSVIKKKLLMSARPPNQILVRAQVLVLQLSTCSPFVRK